jgi:hypothetical protein
MPHDYPCDDQILAKYLNEIEKTEYAEVFDLLRRVCSPKPARTLSKSVPAAVSKPAVSKPGRIPVPKLKTLQRLKPRKKSPLVLVRQTQEPSDRELLGAVSDACARGLISGHDALIAQRLLEQGKPLPKAVRAAILGRPAVV